MPHPAFIPAVLLCLAQTEGTELMTKLDHSLEQAVAAAQTPEQQFPVLIMCNDNCAPVVAVLKEQENNGFTVIDELNLVTTNVNAKTLVKIAAMDAVTSIELDVEASID